MGEGEGGCDGIQRSLGAREFLTQEIQLSRTTLVYACNGLNELSHLSMLWTLRHHWTAGAMFVFNCYRHWAQLLLRQPGELPVTILSREGVTQGDLLLVVLYGSILVPLAKEIRVVEYHPRPPGR